MPKPKKHEQHYTSLQSAFLDLRQYQAFIVCTPITERMMVDVLVNFHKPILVEKPLTPSHSYYWYDEKISSYSDLWVGLQMPFMHSFQQFKKDIDGLRKKYPIDVQVVARSNFRKWRGLRGKHQNVLPPIYEFAHDLNLAYLLLLRDPTTSTPTIGDKSLMMTEAKQQQGFMTHTYDSNSLITFSLDLEWEEEERYLEVGCCGKIARYNINREENVRAYEQLATAFLVSVEQGIYCPYQTTYRDWFKFMASIDVC